MARTKYANNESESLRPPPGTPRPRRGSGTCCRLADRFNIDGFYHPNASRNDTVRTPLQCTSYCYCYIGAWGDELTAIGQINCRGGHSLKEKVAAFDAPFFSMNPSEVESLDPQQQGLLETSYRAFENGKSHAYVANFVT